MASGDYKIYLRVKKYQQFNLNFSCNLLVNCKARAPISDSFEVLIISLCLKARRFPVIKAILRARVQILSISLQAFISAVLWVSVYMPYVYQASVYVTWCTFQILNRNRLARERRGGN